MAAIFAGRKPGILIDSYGRFTAGRESRAERLGSREAPSVELIYVPALDLVEVARVPHHNYIARLFWRALGVHAAFHRQAVALPRVALGARRHHIVPGVRAAA